MLQMHRAAIYATFWSLQGPTSGLDLVKLSSGVRGPPSGGCAQGPRARCRGPWAPTRRRGRLYGRSHDAETLALLGAIGLQNFTD